MNKFDLFATKNNAEYDVYLPVSDWLVLVFLRALKPNNGLPLSSVGPTP